MAHRIAPSTAALTAFGVGARILTVGGWLAPPAPRACRPALVS